MKKRSIVLVLAVALLVVLTAAGTASAYDNSKTAAPVIEASQYDQQGDSYGFGVSWNTDTGGKPVRYALEYSTTGLDGPWTTMEQSKIAAAQIKAGSLGTGYCSWTGMRYYRVTLYTRAGVSASGMIFQISPGD